MKEYLLQNLSELAHRRAINLRDEAGLWDILARDLKREAARREDTPSTRPIRAPISEQPPVEETPHGEKLFVRISEAAQMMGLGRSAIYQEIAASRIKVRKCGRKTLIAVADIHAWFESLPVGLRR